MHFRHCLALAATALLVAAGFAQAQSPISENSGASLYRDVDGILHIVATNEADLVYAQGWAHARDRYFQMDSLRRQASGTLAELLGPSVIDDDVLLRTLGLRRAAERSQGAVSPESLAALESYAAGVNAYVARNGLPPEYTALELTSTPEWTPIDSLVIAKLLAFGLSFDLDVDLTEDLVTYQTAGAGGGFDGAALFFEDMYRSAPFDPASTVPDAGGPTVARAVPQAPDGAVHRGHWSNFDASWLQASTIAGAADYLRRLSDIPIIGDAISRREGIVGSNEWGVAGSRTVSGRPIIANDPHLALDQPATFYQNHLYAPQAGINVIGSSFTGVPFVVLGQNQRITWGATTNPFDVTDTFQETLAPSPDSQFGLGTVTNGEVEPLELVILAFNANQVGDGVNDNVTPIGGLDIPPFALIVPRRNNGPIVSLDVNNLSAVSIQYTGFGATREVDTFRLWNLADNLQDFTDALQFFDFGSQNWAYADIEGNLAYFTSGEMPLREDLQAGTVNGLPPWFIRNGTGGNEWLPADDLLPGQATPNAVLPFAEMPQLVNPPFEFFVNANNDPAGTTLDNDPLNQLRPNGGIYYLNPGYAMGARAGRITQALTDRLNQGPVTAADLQVIQSNVQLLDAEFFTPLIVSAYQAGTADGADATLAALATQPRIAEAVGRLMDWDFSTPTGVVEGYDANDIDGVLQAPDAAEIEASINATVYSVWRGQFARRVVDDTLAAVGLSGPGSAQTMTALRNLVEQFPQRGGVGASGLDFFAVDGVADADTRLAIKTLQSLNDALDRLAGAPFAAAFGNSASQQDYRWGRLHRIVFNHPLGEPYTIPSQQGPIFPSFADLPGVAVDGGFNAVDASSHSARADNAMAFMFGSGPVRRYVGTPGTVPGSMTGETILPGGSAADPTSPWFANLMGRWLTNDTYPMRTTPADIKANAVELTIVRPPRSQSSDSRAVRGEVDMER